VSTADQNPQLQLDALAAANCLKVYTDRASGTKADRPQWNACLADLRAEDTLIIWRIDRLGRNLRNLRDLIDIVTRGPRSTQEISGGYRGWPGHERKGQ